MKLVGRREHLIVGTITAALIFVFVGYLPQSKRMARDREKALTLQEQVHAGTTRLSNAKQTHKTWTDRHRYLAGRAGAVPNDPELGEFLEAVSGLADELGLTNKNVIPADAVESDKVFCLPIEISMSGQFEKMYAFLSRIETLPRVARINRLQIGTSEDLPGELMASMTVYVYYRRT